MKLLKFTNSLTNYINGMIIRTVFMRNKTKIFFEENKSMKYAAFCKRRLLNFFKCPLIPLTRVLMCSVLAPVLALWQSFEKAHKYKSLPVWLCPLVFCQNLLNVIPNKTTITTSQRWNSYTLYVEFFY